MFSQSFNRAAALLAALLLTATVMAGQEQQPALRITRPLEQDKQYKRTSPVAELTRDGAFNRVQASKLNQPKANAQRIQRLDVPRISSFGRTHGSASAPALMSFGTGGGDINEIEPNDQIAQGVSLPVNIFGEISFNRDVDFFAFDAIAGQQITIEAFAARLGNSQLLADIALFDSSGRLLASDVGGVSNDPLIRFVAPRDQTLVAGITDADDFGGPLFDYVLNITRGQDVAEQEPNDSISQRLPNLPRTVFGEIGARNDVDFYSFTASAGQTLIVDVDAEVLGSTLDAEINLSDPDTGVEFFYNDQYDGDDPRFNIVLPYTGRYVIGIGAFNNGSSGFYRVNASLAPSAGAPIVSRLTRLAKKLIQVSGAAFKPGSVVEVNGVARNTTFVDSLTLRAKVKARIGDVVTVSNPPDDRRSNPLLFQ